MSLDWLAIGSLPGHGTLMLAFTIGVFAVFIRDRFEIGSVCLAVLILLPALFFVFPLQGVEPYRFLGGFGHPALVAVCALMIHGRALVLTGVLEPAARRLARLVERFPRLALLVVLFGAALISGFINDTPLVVMLIPLLIAAARRAGRSSATLLMPMNYAVLIGGMATTFGTSTNLIVIGLAASLGVDTIGVFDYYPLVATVALPALLYLWLVAPLLLRNVAAAPAAEAQDVFEAELHVSAASWLDGAEVREVTKRTRSRLTLRHIRRADGSVAAPLPTAVLAVGDRLLVQDTAENLKDWEARLKAPLHAFDPDHAAGDAHAQAVAAQLVVTPHSPLIGRSVRSERLADKYGLVVIGLRHARGDHELHGGDLADARVEHGDVLLMQGPAATLQNVQRDGIGLLLDEQLALPRSRKAPVALATLAGVIAAAALAGVPIALAGLLGVLVLMGTKTLAWHDVGSALSIDVVLVIAASLALGDALAVTGGTASMAQGIAWLASDMPPVVVLGLLMGLIGVVTNFVSNNAAAAIGTPLAIELARLLGVPPEPYVLAVLFGANLCYATPMGYQTNMMVMNAGGYRFGDFVRVGVPLFLLVWLGLSFGLAQRYGL